jgi:hypothetical protein
MIPLLLTVKIYAFQSSLGVASVSLERIANFIRTLGVAIPLLPK